MGYLLKFLQDLTNLRKYADDYANLCIENPFIAILISVPLILYIGYIGIGQFGQFVQSIRNMSKSRSGKVGIILSVLISVLISTVMVRTIRQFKEQKPVLITSDIVIGKLLTLGWDYEKKAKAHDLFYEVQSAKDQQFLENLAPEPNLTQSKFLPIARHINDTRYWRVRAVQPVNHQGEIQQPNGKLILISPWSNALKISQYESNYERIKHTRMVNVYVSDSFNQGFYKFIAGSQATGFDIELVRLIMEELPNKMGIDGNIRMELKTVPWAELLSTPSKGDADIIISTITKSSKREEQYSIVFSEPYDHTTLSLIYKSGKNVNSIRDTIKKGGSIGVMAKTTSATLLEVLKRELLGENIIKIVEFKQWMEAISKLREPSPETAQEFSSNIDYVVAETPFAQAAQLTYQGELAYKEFSANDFPQGTPQSEYEEWYALAVRAGEPKLIGNINDVLKNLHEQGRLQVLKQDSIRSFEKSIGKKEP